MQGAYPQASAGLRHRRICRLPGCDKPCYVEGNIVHDYCGRTHAQQDLSHDQGHAAGGGAGGSRKFRSHSVSGCQSRPIYFYNRGEPYYEFTNFHQAVVKIDGEDWLTTEHYFQAQKFVGTPLVGTIRLMERPREAFDKSRDPRYSHWRRSDWEEVKEKIMFKALQAKFTQHENLKKKLLDTKDRKLVERSPYDSYWGDGGDGTGKNRLGELLMKLRNDLTPKPAPSPQSNIHPGPPSPPAAVHSHLLKDTTSPPLLQHQPSHASTKLDPSQSISKCEQSGAQHHLLQNQPGLQQKSVQNSMAALQGYPPPTRPSSTPAASVAAMASNYGGQAPSYAKSQLVVQGTTVQPIPHTHKQAANFPIASNLPTTLHGYPPQSHLATGNDLLSEYDVQHLTRKPLHPTSSTSNTSQRT